MTKQDSTNRDAFGLLLVQLGFHAAGRFAERLVPLGLEPRHVGMLNRLAAHEGLSQQALGETLGITPNRMVFLVDDLEERGFAERRKNPADRRSHALYLTAKGRDALKHASVVASEHEAALGAALSPNERTQLVTLLGKVASEQGIDRNALPGPPSGRIGAHP
jgi:DNA-binding MarR family transcriptional regulator